jgi:hypothetical protein
LALALVESESQASTAAFMLEVVMLVSKTRLLSSAAAGLKAKSATQMNQSLPRVVLCKVRHKVTTTQD